MNDAKLKRMLMLTVRHQEPMALYRGADGRLCWHDTEEEPEFIREAAEAIDGFSVFEGEVGTLGQADLDGDTEIGYEGGYSIGDEWTTGKVRPATIADVLEIFPDLCTAPVGATAPEEKKP